MSKNVLIIGSSRGIGLSLVQEYTKRGYNIVATCRNKNSELQSLTQNILEGLDLLDQESPKILTDYLKQHKFIEFDTVIYNAGVLNSSLNLKQLSQIQTSDFKEIQNEFHLNCISPMMIFSALMDPYFKIRKFGAVSSRMGCINETSGKYHPYRISKSALNMTMRSFSQEIKQNNQMVAILHPGFVDTEMTASFQSSDKIQPQISAQGLVDRMEKDLTLETSGTFWNYKGDILNW